MAHIYNSSLLSNLLRTKSLLLVFSVIIFNADVKAQCPQNIDFEDGTFNRWQCWTGSVNASTGIQLPTLSGPQAGRHTMLSQGAGNDMYGGFPVNCPNGSGHSIKLGNNTGGAQAEGVSYTFTISPLINKFSLIYHYAVVFQGPAHNDAEQPRFEVTVKNITDGTTVNCSSNLFFYHSGGGNPPGFQTSPLGNSANPILYKDWAANTVNLDNLAGKTIELFFKTSDCTFTAHFGYGYVDVNTECSSTFVGAAYCPEDTAINVTGPYGYQAYSWWNSSFTQVLGGGQTLHLEPPPPSGTNIAVVTTPYNGYGCVDTFYAQLLDTLHVTAEAGADKLSCNGASVQIGTPPRIDFKYEWTPTTGLSNPFIANPTVTPATNGVTKYYVNTTSMGGKCLHIDSVLVTSSILDPTVTVIGGSAQCASSGTNTILQVGAADNIQWFKDNVAILGANGTQYTVTQTGTYKVTVSSNVGCSSTSLDYALTIYPKPVAGFSINNTDQCLDANQFVFTNTSSISNATPLQYAWTLDDGSPAQNSTDVTYSYTQARTYQVKLVVLADGGCTDSVTHSVVVRPIPDTALTLQGVDSYCTASGQTSILSVKPGNTVQWYKDNLAIPGATGDQYTVNQSGIYYALLTNSANCSLATAAKTIDVFASPTAGFTVNNISQCFDGHVFDFTNTSAVPSASPLQYSWDLGDGSPEQITRDISNYSYAKPGDYNVKMLVTADGGCKDSVITNIHIYASPKADFTALPICVNLNVPFANRTINNSSSVVTYLWDFGNGDVSTVRNPQYAYPAPGTYTVRLSVSTLQCPATINTKSQTIVIDAPTTPVRYADIDAVTNFPEKLTSRNFGSSILWTPAVQLSETNKAVTYFRGFNPQLYTIEIKTSTGCLTVDTQQVKIHKKIAIYVPTVFTPGNGDGKNDLLRPLLMGFKEVNYFRVYDRWGKLLFEMKNDRPGWDGRVRGNPQETGSVVWMLEAVDMDGVVHKAQGSTVLIR